MAGGASGPDGPHGGAGQESSVDHPVVARQRGLRRRQFRCHLRLDPRAGSVATRDVRAGGTGRSRGSRHPDVRPRLHARGIRPRARRPAVHHVRVRACDGQQRGESRRVLGHHLRARHPAGWLHLGLGGPGPVAHGRGRHPLLRVRRRFRASRHRERSQLPAQRTRHGRPQTATASVRGEEGLPARRNPRGRPGGRRDRGREPLRVHISLVPGGDLGCFGRRPDRGQRRDPRPGHRTVRDQARDTRSAGSAPEPGR